MTQTFDLIIHNGTLMTPGGRIHTDVGIRDGKIVAIENLSASDAAEKIDATGLHVLPGAIDTQVHFREPGGEHKEDLESGTRAAVMGGITGVFEMPNTNPLTTTRQALADKITRASGRAWCNHAFYMGGTAENAADMADLERSPGCCGVKVFMGSSTGNLLVEDDESLRAVLSHGVRRVAVHAEDEPRLIERKKLAEASGDVHSHPIWRDDETAIRATKRLINIVRETGRRAHLLHVTTADEMRIIADHKDLISVEATPQHLTMSAPDCYDRLGPFAQMNPPIRDEQHRQGLWWGMQQGVVDIIGSDHAPHSAEEKQQPYPNSPSGMPGVQTLMPVMLNHVAKGRLSLEHLVDLVAGSPARLFGIIGKGRIATGFDADFTLVDLERRREITDDWIESKCGWTPFNGETTTGWPVGTIIAGRNVMRDGELLGVADGQPMKFFESENTDQFAAIV
jgi:dihydroorotase